jgi:methylenetetrahydrofolate reductase (NADPH)
LQEALKNYPSVTFYAINIKGEGFSNTSPSVSAVTWGVFPGKEIVQPTVVDPESFRVWKDEAFALWKTNWAAMYSEGSESRKLLDNMINSYYLVAMVDNNFIDGDAFAPFEEVIKQQATK